ncbi:fluoride efflux transporter CrcB [Stappia sp. ES.058]|uniref:fluoride efflux transporter CrcB n=1 Tax=Stappia sp. ES.058 TaxID=1881061 RepID=UPI00087B3EA0|nr:fluoride efflux transporter CrcB [Stappia sp. ES.058]SDU20507.1 camphor resistance protein CrcB [Stappia sp. ES.058]
MTHFLLVALGGALGAGSRHLVNQAALRWVGPGFPVGTLTVNILGSLAMGLLIGWLAARTSPGGTGAGLRLFLATGVLGGFTTFSAFSLDVVFLWERGQPMAALGYAAVSVAASLVALLAGLWGMRALAG